MGCANTCDDTTQALKRRKLEEPQQQPLSADPGTTGLDKDERLERSVAFQVRPKSSVSRQQILRRARAGTLGVAERDFRNLTRHSIFESDTRRTQRQRTVQYPLLSATYALAGLYG